MFAMREINLDNLKKNLATHYTVECYIHVFKLILGCPSSGIKSTLDYFISDTHSGFLKGNIG